METRICEACVSECTRSGTTFQASSLNICQCGTPLLRAPSKPALLTWPR